MPGTESLIPHEWYQKAEEDLLAAQALWQNAPQLQASIIFHLQQAVEKYLKGFLLSRGWTLQRIHDLVRLLGDVIAYEPAFVQFDTLCDELTSHYFQSRYPLTPLFQITEQELQQLFVKVEELIVEIKQRT
ncbi:MAG TPA: HEPN domain-containing protein [Anaerolineae bacterium]